MFLFVGVVALLETAEIETKDGSAEQLPAHGPQGRQPDREGVLYVVPVRGVPHQGSQGSPAEGARGAGGPRVRKGKERKKIEGEDGRGLKK